MHLIPFLVQMIYFLVQMNNQHHISNADQNKEKTFSYVQEKKIQDFLEQGLKLKQAFLEKLEEEKKQEEIEEEEKYSEDRSSQMEDEGHSYAADDNEQNLVNITLD
mmetsp:Transcript_44130/g.42831  ORF Transcript_44130/g.42831 Transcript_44130/m.42831 type:complete len:106 (-) Transcript_44130:314-631(-)